MDFYTNPRLTDCPQIMVFEMVYLLLRTVFEITRTISGTKIASRLGT